MYRQYSSRSQRNRGIKVKHALQICLFLAVCFWLIYQVKRSHDTKNEFEESDAKGSMDDGSSGGLIKIGRKDIRPLYQEIVTANKLHNEAAEEEETTEVENKHEEAPDNKVNEEDEALRNGDDETDLITSEVDKVDTEVDQEEGNITDEGREEGIDSETGGETSDDGNGGKQDSSVEDGGHDGGDKSNHEAREELYKADDASSAVTHDNHTQTTENENKVVGISGHHHGNILELENKENHGEEANNGEMKERLEVDIGEISQDANRSGETDIAKNLITSETKENNSNSSNKVSSLNSTLTEAPDDNLAASNGTTDVTTQDPKFSEQNVAESVPELDHDQGIVTESTSTEGSNFKTSALQQANNSTLDVENHLSDSTSTDGTESINLESNLEDFSKPSNDTDSFSDTDSFTVVRVIRSEHSLEDGANTQMNETVSAKSDVSDGKDGSTGICNNCE